MIVLVLMWQLEPYTYKTVSKHTHVSLSESGDLQKQKKKKNEIHVKYFWLVLPYIR
jgi:hypothetical protein